MPKPLAPIRLCNVEFIEEDNKANVTFYLGEEINNKTGDYDEISEEVAYPSPDSFTPDQVVTRAALNLVTRLEGVMHLWGGGVEWGGEAASVSE